MTNAHPPSVTCMRARAWWHPFILIVAMLLTVATWRPVAQGGFDRAPDAKDSALAQMGLAPQTLDARVVAAWNSLAHDIAYAADQFLTFKGQRALAMMHLAMHDALNSIVPLHDRYAYSGDLRAADPVVAAAQAAHTVLVSEYPDRQEQLDDELAAWLAETEPGDMKKRGIELGRAAANAVMTLRAGDGWDLPGDYAFRDGAGEYQTTPPWDGFVAQPGFRYATPFALDSPSRFRPPPPPPLASRTYARAVQEVQESGALHRARRTDDQTAYAVWWMEYAEGSVNRLARQLVTADRSDLWAAARLFAHVGVALFDTYVAIWDSKYEYNHWRPYTAVRRADQDGNPRTVGDQAWEPLRPTPPFPEYASAHAAGCAASLGVLERGLGDRSFTMETTTAPPGMPTRTFPSFRAAAEECADSRVRLGWHFRYAVQAGAGMGRRIARYVVDHTLRPVTGPGVDGKGPRR